ncbi:MAG TPA: TonB-dependent receptor [Terriglobia bacterium]|nr:TonB-dependent receptor [Terriglobia bacterium]
MWAQSTPAPPNLMDMGLEDLMKVEIDSVYGASGYKQKVADAPASITIITADEITRHGYRTLADILRNVPGFYVTYDRDYDYLGERGFGPPGDYNSRFLLLVDGHRLNDNIFDQAFIGTDFPVDVDLIDRIEVIRGPNSSLYVASALLGIINVVTKQVREAQGVAVAAEVASYGTFISRLTYSHHFGNGLEMLLSGSYYNSHGQEALYFPEFANPATNFGIAQNADYDEYGHFFANLSYGHFRLEAAYGSREKGVPTGAFGSVFDDTANRTIDSRQYLDLKYDRNFGSDWGVMGHVYIDRYPYSDTFIFDLSAFGGPSRAVFNAHGPGEWWGAEGAASKKLLGNQTLVVGAEFRDNFRQDMVNNLVQPSLSVADVRTSSTIAGVYAQDEISLHRGLVLDLGLRYDQYSTFGGTANPRAALICQPFEKTTVKLLYGQSFRAPNAYELYFQSTNPFFQALLPNGNPNLKPETARTAELVVEQDLSHQFLFVVSGYYYPIRRLINAETDPTTGAYVYQNSQHVNLRGTEISIKRQARSGLEAGVSLSLQDPQTGNDEPLLTNSPRTLVQANLSVPLFHRQLYASTDINYVSRRSTLHGNFAEAYAVPSFTLFSNAIKHWDVSVSLYNAFNQRFGDPAGPDNPQDVIVQDGRNFRVRFAYHF